VGTPVHVELTDVVLDLELCCDRRAPAAVREAIAGLADGGWVLGDAMLVATELVTNAVLHAGADETDEIAVRIRRVRDGLLISVSDPGRSGTDAHIVGGTRPLFGGYGLQVVAAIASRWGSERGDGYRVWAELPLVDDPA
jgi:serine/threonine-protein kinase RsbW